MALYRYFQTSEKSSRKLPDPRGPLSRLVPASSIVPANEKVQSVLESKERTQSGRKGQRYSKLSPELKAGMGRQAAEHTAWLLRSGCTLKSYWAMGVVNLKLEVGGASTTWRSSKIKSRKV